SSAMALLSVIAIAPEYVASASTGTGGGRLRWVGRNQRAVSWNLRHGMPPSSSRASPYVRSLGAKTFSRRSFITGSRSRMVGYSGKRRASLRARDFARLPPPHPALPGHEWGVGPHCPASTSSQPGHASAEAGYPRNLETAPTSVKGQDYFAAPRAG